MAIQTPIVDPQGLAACLEEAVGRSRFESLRGHEIPPEDGDRAVAAECLQLFPFTGDAATVQLNLHTDLNWAQTVTDREGGFSLSVPAVEDLEPILGPIPLAHRRADYYLSAEVEGYKLFYQDGIHSPGAGKRSPSTSCWSLWRRPSRTR